jgi:Putative abortive phage resistance protein AbiGi, antitoxin
MQSIVCFCDIPVEDLPLHTSKYSAFGLAFLKRFLIPRGASPVFYVAWQSASTVPDSDTGRLTRADLFDQTEPEVLSLVEAHARSQGVGSAPDVGDSAQRHKAACLRSLVLHELLPFFKFFDAELPDDAADNFYMEREWRVIGRVTFDLADVERVIIPRAYAARFRNDLPEYVGQLTFSL